MGAQEANQACSIFLRFADGETSLSPVMPRYLAELMVGHLNVIQHWEGRRLAGTEIKPLSFSVSSREMPDD